MKPYSLILHLRHEIFSQEQFSPDDVNIRWRLDTDTEAVIVVAAHSDR